LFFSNENSLYGNDLNSDTVSEVIGNISGLASGATFMNDNYYYYNQDPSSQEFGQIMEIGITFDTISGWNASSTPNFSHSITNDINFDLDITDMASSDGIIYMIGTDHNLTPDNTDDDMYWLVAWDGSSYSLTSANLSADAQIAFGADNVLYTIQNDANGESYIQTMDPATGNTSPDNLTDGEHLTGDGSGNLGEITGGIVR